MRQLSRQPDPRLDWWHEAKFGLFIHWGLYSIPAGYWKGESVYGIGEWIMQNGQIPVADYAALASEFQPAEFDADEWVLIAKNAGMQYLIVTAKHHDGFAMFATDASPFNIMDASPFRRDPIKELADACGRHGLKFGIYYSQAQDWHHPGGASRSGHWDPAQDGDMTDYIRTVAVPQVRELLTKYGPVSVFFWDTPFEITAEQAGLLAPLLALQPEIITNDRLGGGFGGDIETPEQFIPSAGSPGRNWEVCMTMNGTWGYRSDDHDWKPVRTLLQNLIDVVSKGGNYLLNVGPDAAGSIPAPSRERLLEIGDWMRVNGESLRGASPSPFVRHLAWGRCTQKPGRLYLSVWEWPENGLLSVPILNSVRRAFLLASPENSLNVSNGSDAVVIALPVSAPDSLAAVIVLDIDGPAQVAPLPPLRQQLDGTIILNAENADFGDGRESAEVHWQVQVTSPGEFEATLAYAADPNTVDNGYTLRVNGLPVSVSDPGRWCMLKSVSLGRMQIEAVKTTDFCLQPLTASRMAVLGVRELTLRPVRE
jgi:alpha-L-fucosidase